MKLGVLLDIVSRKKLNNFWPPSRHWRGCRGGRQNLQVIIHTRATECGTKGVSAVELGQSS